MGAMFIERRGKDAGWFCILCLPVTCIPGGLHDPKTKCQSVEEEQITTLKEDQGVKKQSGFTCAVLAFSMVVNILKRISINYV